MHYSDERVIVILLVGGVAGYLTSRVMRGSGFGLIGDAAVGIVGALIGVWLLPRFDFHIAGGVMRLIIDAAIGAIVLLLILRSVGAASGSGAAR
jgi:uncharacterized membrane protein YeaQ/YmgE (transglycosylase-associated protein family)